MNPSARSPMTGAVPVVAAEAAVVVVAVVGPDRAAQCRQHAGELLDAVAFIVTEVSKVTV